MESFDVTSLHTNVSNDSALEATFELLTKHQNNLELYGFTIPQVMAVLNECLNCKVFQWSGQYFNQLRGLAMGQRLAPALAITFMSRIEARALAHLTSSSIATLTIAPLCVQHIEMICCFDLLNAQSPLVKFTREKPKDGWLLILNMQLRLVGRTLETKFCRKPSSKNILVHATSAHPKNIKQAVIANMFSTAKRVASSGALKEESLHLAYQIASSNGYSKLNAGKQYHRICIARSHPKPVESAKVSVCMPFACDNMSRSLRACLRSAHLQETVRIVDMPPPNLKRLLVRNRFYDRSCDSLLATFARLVGKCIAKKRWLPFRVSRLFFRLHR